MDKLFVRSPYLHINKQENSNRSVLVNHLTARANVYNEKEKKLMEMGNTPCNLSLFINLFGEDTVKQWLQKKILLEQDSIWKENCATLVEIETSTVCNWKCQFCPNTFFKRKKRFQSLELFHDIIKKSADYGYIRYVSLHGYNEPTIDPLFLQRVDIIRKYKLKLVLFTNGTGVTKDILNSLANSGVLRSIYFNLPSVNPAIFIQRTGYKNPELIINHIQYAIDIGLKVIISVQGTKEEQLSELPLIEKKFPSAGITAIPSFDRAGVLKNYYNQDIHLNKRYLNGCGFVLTNVHIGIDGEMYLCLEDFFKKNVYANITDGSLSQILQCNKLQELKKKIWGDIYAEPDFICRKCIVMKGMDYTKLK